MFQEKSVKPEVVRAITVPVFVMAVMLSAAWAQQAQDAKALYPSMAPIEQYLMANRNAEIALAQSAAPESISRDAEVLVLGRHGYETAVKGRTVSCASWSVPGRLPSIPRTFGILSCVVRSA